MRFKAAFVMGLAAGYVLGSRAGRQRYEQIKRVSRSVSENPAVKRATDKVQAQAAQLGNQALQAVQDRAGSVGHDLAGKVTSTVTSNVRSRFGRSDETDDEINLDADRSYANGTMT